MNKLVCIRPGYFEYGESEYPIEQKGHAIIKIRKIGICGTDIHAFEGTQPYFNYPRVLGHELACEFVEGYAPHGIKAGDQVTIIPYLHCGKCVACRKGKTNCCQQMKVLGVHIDGGMTEYLSVPSDCIIGGKELPLETLALIEPLSVSAHGVRRASIEPGEFVMIFGAGPIGLGAMVFALLAGAKVIAIDINEKRLSFCRESLNVSYAFNGRDPNLQERVREITDGDMAGVVIDATGNLESINSELQFLAHGGQYVLIGLQKENISISHPEFHKREATMMSSRNATRSDFEYVMKCIQEELFNPGLFITNRIKFEGVKDFFPHLLKSNEVIKTIIELN